MIAPKKSLGQHFLHDANIIRKIADAVRPPAGSRVVEIGPGPGALTRVLYPRHPDMLAVEVDARAVEVLRRDLPGLQVLHQDILHVDLGDFQQLTMVGNLPYFLTSPILFAVLDARKHLHEAVFMIQKEVAERLVARPRTKAYGILSVQTQLWCTPEYLFTVPPEVFTPPPNVDSAVVRLSFDRPEPAVDDATFKRVVRTAFNQRRKKLSNALGTLLTPENRPQVARWLDQRAEELSPEEFVELAGLLGG